MRSLKSAASFSIKSVGGKAGCVIALHASLAAQRKHCDQLLACVRSRFETVPVCVLSSIVALTEPFLGIFALIIHDLWRWHVLSRSGLRNSGQSCADGLQSNRAYMLLLHMMMRHTFRESQCRSNNWYQRILVPSASNNMTLAWKGQCSLQAEQGAPFCRLTANMVVPGPDGCSMRFTRVAAH
jgi:hypothetical protein